MRAMRFHEFGGPERLREDVIDRPNPGVNEVLIELSATAVNPADWLRVVSPEVGLGVQMPYTPGMDFAGVVREVGSDTVGLQVGDHVYGAEFIGRCGTYAEYAAVPADIVASAPKSIALHEAAAVPLAAMTAWEVLGRNHADIRAGQRVLIQGGAGGTGSFAVQFAKRHGAHVIATSSARNHDLLRSLGADEVVDYQSARWKDAVRAVDAVVDLVGGEAPLSSISLIREGGVLASIVPMPQTVAACKAAVANQNIRLSFVDMSVNRDTAVLEMIARLIDLGELKAVVSGTYPLAQAAQALERSRAGHVSGKLVLTIAALKSSGSRT
ncbi:NADP-dependent oxidoreductase [Pandoraea sp. NPDC087047]|uniref:NADP-dependent oxidoreductase n=1 Tax=Pandoraea sp. NPDC087047 TaxID=3364390 RepID=UPI0038085C86